MENLRYINILLEILAAFCLPVFIINEIVIFNTGKCKDKAAI